MTERQRLVEELSKVMPCNCIDAYKLRKLSAPDCPNCNFIEDIVDWVIKDRRRILEPLVAYKNMIGESGDKWPQGMEDIAIEEALKLAGL